MQLVGLDRSDMLITGNRGSHTPYNVIYGDHLLPKCVRIFPGAWAGFHHLGSMCCSLSSADALMLHSFQHVMSFLELCAIG